MVKFCAPSASPSLHSSASACIRPAHGQVQPAAPAKPRPTLRRREHKLDKAAAAGKACIQRSRLAEPPSTRTRVVFVGNIGPDLDANALRAHFKCCGNIIQATIHCCGGVAMTTKPPPSTYTQDMDIRQYGIITFDSTTAVDEACKMAGTLLGERRITVCTHIAKLPEVLQKIEQRLKSYRERMEPEDAHRAEMSALRSIKKHDPTVLLDPQHEKGGKRRRRGNLILSHSFPEAII